MKNFFIITGLTLIFALFFNGANDRTRPLLSATCMGLLTDNSYVSFGGAAADTLVVSDSISYVFSITHSKPIIPYFSVLWTKIGNGTVTATMHYYQSNDGSNYYAIKKGKTQSAYTTTLSAAATGYSDFSFMNDTAKLEGRYLKVTFISSSTSAVKGKITGKVKFNQL